MYRGEGGVKKSPKFLDVDCGPPPAELPTARRPVGQKLKGQTVLHIEQ